MQICSKQYKYTRKYMNDEQGEMLRLNRELLFEQYGNFDDVCLT